MSFIIPSLQQRELIKKFYCLPPESNIVATYCGIIQDYCFVSEGANVSAYIRDKKTRAIVVIDLVADKSLTNAPNALKSYTLAQAVQKVLNTGFYPLFANFDNVIFRPGLVGGMLLVKGKEKQKPALSTPTSTPTYTLAPYSPRDWTQPIPTSTNSDRAYKFCAHPHRT